MTAAAANLTEFAKTPLLNKTELEELGYNIAIYPVTSLRLSMKAVEDGFAAIKRRAHKGSTGCRRRRLPS